MRNTRRGFLRTCAVSTLSSMLPTKQLLAILEYRKYHQCLPDFLTRLATDAYQSRNARLKELSDRRSIREYQNWARHTFWKLIGGKLEKTPLNSRITKIIVEHEDYDHPFDNFVFGILLKINGFNERFQTKRADNLSQAAVGRYWAFFLAECSSAFNM